MKIYFSQLAENKLIKLTEYLTTEWNLKVKNKFLSELDEKLVQIISQPDGCPKSEVIAGLYK